ncbi:MAG TPA: GNAT family N-acetyltransferase [Propionibacteriaceae bacterium]|nr:GNAT family N-acetyltransferase [Propionibacteriaceae bacterium]
MQLNLTVRDLEPDDLAELDWSGGPEHLRALADAWQRSLLDETAVLVVVLDSGRVVACGAVDYTRRPEVGFLWMVVVHETLQGVGIGSTLITALEARVAERGLSRVQLRVEYDNPRAAALYRRLGYREVGSTVDSWAVAGGRTYVTVSAVLQRDLDRPGQ